MKKLILVCALSLLLASCGQNNGGVIPNVPETTEGTVITTHVDTTDAVMTDAVTSAVPTDTDVPDTTASDTTADTVADTIVDTETAQTTTVEVPKNVVYLTFDDGPGRYTERVIEILDKYDIKATFFVIGGQAEKYPDQLRAIYEAGHTVACHSVSHDYAALYAGKDAISADIEAWENIAREIIGVVPESNLYRFPGGSTCAYIDADKFSELHMAVNDLGYRAFDWTCGNNDKYFGDMLENESKPDYLMRSMKSSFGWCGEIKIVLLHETVTETVDMLDEIIEFFIEKGYVFAPLDVYDGEYIFRK